MHFRYIELARGTWGASLLIAPRRTLTHIPYVRIDRRAVVIARILGSRHLAQASLSGLDPSPEILAGGVWVDSVHALTSLGLAAFDRRRAGAGVIDAVIAGTWAVFGWRSLHRGRVPPPSHDRDRDRLARRLFKALPGGARLMAEARVARDRR
jgi:hypothetical protein